jgi:hypothetical protein
MMGADEVVSVFKGIIVFALWVIVTFVLIAFCVGFFFAGHGQAAEIITFDQPVANFTLGQEPAPQLLCIPVPKPPLCVPQLPSKRSFLASSGPGRPFGPGRPGTGCTVPEPNNGMLLVIAVLCLLFVAQRQRKI